MLVRKPARQVLFILLTAALTLTSCNMGATPAPTIDANAINTAAFSTAMAQISSAQTQTALAAPSATSTITPLPLPTLSTAAAGSAVPGATSGLPTVSFNTTNTTPLPGFTPVGSPAVPGGVKPTAALNDSCSSLVFEGDVTVPDWTVLPGGENFEKVWAVRNTGTCKWDEGYALIYQGGSNPDLDPYDFKFKGAQDFVDPGEGFNITISLTTPCTPGKYEGHWRMRNDRGYYFGDYLSVYVEVKEKNKKCAKS